MLQPGTARSFPHASSCVLELDRPLGVGAKPVPLGRRRTSRVHTPRMRRSPRAGPARTRSGRAGAGHPIGRIAGRRCHLRFVPCHSSHLAEATDRSISAPRQARPRWRNCRLARPSLRSIDSGRDRHEPASPGLLLSSPPSDRRGGFPVAPPVPVMASGPRRGRLSGSAGRPSRSTRRALLALPQGPSPLGRDNGSRR
jgi:hypothetical protein